MRRIAKDSLIVGVGQALTVVGRFGTLWWLTRVLDTEAFGRVALIQGVAALGFGVLCGSLLQAVLRFHGEAAAHGTTPEIRRVLRPMVVRSSIWTFSVLCGGALLWKWISGSPVSAAALTLGLLIVVPDASRLYEINALNAARRQAAYVAWSVADSLARPLLAAAAVAWIGPSAEAALLGFLLAAFAVNAIFRRLYAAPPAGASVRLEAAVDRQRILRFAVPLMPLALMAWIVGIADRYVLAGTAGTAAAGVYAAAYGLGSQGFLALGLSGLTVFRPIYFSAIDTGDRARARRVLGVWVAAMLAGSLAGVTILYCGSDLVAAICLGARFRSGAALLPWIGAAYTFQTMQMVFEVLLYARHDTRSLLVVQAAGAATALVLYAVLIPRMGAMGAAIATIASFAVSSTLAALLGDLAGALSRGGKLG